MFTLKAVPKNDETCYTVGMANAPKLPHWKVRVEEKNKPPRFEFLNALQIATRKQLGQVISGEANASNMYYQEDDGSFRRAK